MSSSGGSDVAFKAPLPMAPPPPPASKVKSTPKASVQEQESKASIPPSTPSVAVNAPPSSAPPAQPKPPVTPAQSLKGRDLPLPYKEPSWGGAPPPGYSLEVLKGGAIVETLRLEDKGFFTAGRWPACDLRMEHPSLSRYHALLQYRAREGEGQGEDGQPEGVGFYLYDLESTHGSYHNKKRCFPRRYYRLRVGHTVKLGGSTRMLVLQGPEGDMEEETAESATELQEKARAKAEEKRREKEQEEKRKREKKEKADKEEADRGISWGMREDAVEEDDDNEEEHPDMSKNPFSQGGGGGSGPTPNEHHFSADPKKTLRGWFEREGLDLPEYQCEEKGHATFECRLELPLDAALPGEEAVTAEATVRGGKKKEAVAQCALEACRILDRKGLLRQANQESRAKKQARKLEEQDYYGSDEDDFLDRTGEVERKRKARMRLAGKEGRGAADTFESLVEKSRVAEDELQVKEKELEAAMASLHKNRSADKGGDEEDLDAYMASLAAGGGASADKESARKLKSTVAELRKEAARLKKLVEIARPASLPALKPVTTKEEQKTGEGEGAAKKKVMGITIGKRGGMGKMRTLAVTAKVVEKKSPSVQPTSGVSDVKDKSVADTPPPSRDASIKPSSGEEQQPSSRLEEGSCERKSQEEQDKDSENQQGEKISGEKEKVKAAKPSQPSSAMMRGPMIPEHLRRELQKEAAEAEDEDGTEAGAEAPAETKRRGDRGRKRRKGEDGGGPGSKKGDIHEITEEDLDADYQDVANSDKYAVWKPPKNQTGDGRTSLNDKLGY